MGVWKQSSDWMRVITLREIISGFDREDLISSWSVRIPFECSDGIRLCMVSLGFEWDIFGSKTGRVQKTQVTIMQTCVLPHVMYSFQWESNFSYLHALKWDDQYYLMGNVLKWLGTFPKLRQQSPLRPPLALIFIVYSYLEWRQSLVWFQKAHANIV